jgi:CheY-like chemotaxis protein
VTIVADADRQGRALAAQTAKDLAQCADVVVADLAPDREDGYDLTDWLREHPRATGIATGEVGAATNTPQNGEDR